MALILFILEDSLQYYNKFNLTNPVIDKIHLEYIYLYLGHIQFYSVKIQTSYFKNRSLDLTLSDYLAGNPEYFQTTPAAHIPFGF